MTGKTNGRASLRPVRIQLDCLDYPEASCLVSMGRTKVLCAATIERKVPPFLEGRAKGWVTAEYGMLPRSTQVRMTRERFLSRPNSRALEISRFIGRSLRAAVSLEELGERTVTLDCDVLQADGGTRCCAVNGASVALFLALSRAVQKGELPQNPMVSLVAAVSVGLVSGKTVLDLSYEQDCRAEVDLNVVMNGEGRFVEIQGAAEGSPFDGADLENMLGLARKGITRIIRCQRKALGIE